VANYTSVGDVIAQTDLLVIAPSRVARAFTASRGLKSRELPIPMPAFSVRVHWSARHEGKAAHAWMRELLISTISRL
jgi:DNA-binding transcriptional LysR family regulator